ncbi:NAD(P)/FAD-dependent oxidoreductase [Salisediminibacterium halotolerans]|uniref:Ferredoxin--NADP reductase n=1 Tax=Salisediminibacterium halotolerans TaxID=517425 RepID=A0A1H9WRA4_9BACI|nr:MULTISPECIES: NAD(P)/FAD-dependent oxidoreductase [Salisediminibacterium]RLJ75381.1 thioredoxin reductase (NADPH) [Actinophytocola xinjiangensis]RPE89235.1 thioredoxin reductase (NADPH) [Salisediminibacterium halotolerans]TWG35994.1 thioredoxin reductase (NADPH) [Salisediminibacterium halotolerans]SES36415.1 thioredoxin reductase (NADPH) [Salisediminibacterium haloalkalitolerans]GEL07788.1 ferredoxin--NADP reductase [Salisediminibacterium halotolerans]
MSEEKEVYDITIIGGGPVGIFTAFYAGLRQAKVKLIEAMPQLGGQLSALYPEKYIYDIAGFPKVRAQELVDNLTEQTAQFEPTYALEESVESVEKGADNVFTLRTDKGVHYSKTVIITAGVGAFKPRRLDIEGAEQFEGKNLHYFVNDLNQFSGDRVVLAGGGDSAVDWTLMLEEIAEEITIVHRRNKFRAHEHSVEQLMNSEKINVVTPYVVHELHHDGDKITAVTLKEKDGENTKRIDIDTLIVNYGFISNLGPIKNWGLEIEKNSIVVNSNQETNIAGIYACGDICTYEGKAKLIASGFGEAPTAVNKAKVYIDPTASATAGHSSSIMS